MVLSFADDGVEMSSWMLPLPLGVITKTKRRPGVTHIWTGQGILHFLQNSWLHLHLFV